MPTDSEECCQAGHRKTRQLLTCPVLHTAHFPPHRPVFDPLDRSPATPLPTQYDTTRACIATCRGETDATTLAMCFAAMVVLSQYARQLQQEIVISQNTFFPVGVGATCYQTTKSTTLLQLMFLTLQAVYHQEQAYYLPYVPLLLHQATVCVLLDSGHHHRSVLSLFPRLPSLEFQDQDVQDLFFKKKEDFVSVQAPFAEDTVDPAFI